VGTIEIGMTKHVSPLQFNVFNEDGKLHCPCCGFADQVSRHPYEARSGSIGSGICGACLWEPGFDDDLMASSIAEPTILVSLLSYRAEWIAAECPWRGSEKFRHPNGWSAHTSLQ
jgi:hypothetical protein